MECATPLGGCRPTHCLPLILSIFALAACGALWPFLRSLSLYSLFCALYVYCICCAALSYPHWRRGRRQAANNNNKTILTKARALVFYAKLRYFCVGAHCCCSCSVTVHIHIYICVCVFVHTYSGRPFAHNVLFGFCTCILCAPWLLLLLLRCYLWHLTP